MIETAYIFAKNHVRKNSKRILQTTHPYLAGILAMCVAYNFYGFGLHFSIDQNFAMFQNYDTVVFGFTPTAMAITLTIASGSFLKFISSHEFDGRTAFRAAAFVLAWNSLIHSVAFLMVFIAKNSILSQQNILPTELNSGQRFLLFFVLWMQFYAFFQFVVTNLTLFEIADLFGIFIQKFGRENDE